MPVLFKPQSPTYSLGFQNQSKPNLSLVFTKNRTRKTLFYTLFSSVFLCSFSFMLSILSSMEWTRGPAIGRGATATVHLATDIRSGELFAVKSAELSRAVFLRKEQSFLSKLSSSRIVKYLGFDVTAENDVPMYNLRMEYVPNTLFDVIRSQGGRLDEPLIRLYAHQILQGLDHLHESGLAHCDIKSQNILIGEEGVKIADLGCAKLAGEVDGNEDSAVSKFSGTPVFMAPEVARGEEQGFEADIWALGCTVIEMATGLGPWPDMNDPVSALYRIGYSDHIPEFPSWLSKKGKDFLSKCLKRDWRQRGTVKELLGHPFLLVSESRSEQQVKAKTSSPLSVLDKDLWDSFEASEGHQGQEFEGSSLNSAEERIKMLISDTFSSIANFPDWSCDEEDWFTIRSNSCEDSQDFTESVHEEELSFVDSSALDEELSFDHSVEIVSTFVSERNFVISCSVVGMELQNELDSETFLLCSITRVILLVSVHVFVVFMISILQYFCSLFHMLSLQLQFCQKWRHLKGIHSWCP